MSEYVLETKKTYTQTENWPIKLTEYMILHHRTHPHKSLLLKMQNQSLYDIKKIEIEIKQLNSDEQILSTANYSFDNLNIYAYNSYFIPSQKIKLNSACEMIEYTLNRIESDNKMHWAQGSWLEKEKKQITHNKKVYDNTTILKLKKTAFPYFITFSMIIIHTFLIIILVYLINL